MGKPSGRRPLGRRRRRLRITLWSLAALTAFAAVVLGWLHWRDRPEAYRPGEEMSDITRELARNLPPGAPAPRFTDVTAEAGLGGFHSFEGDRSSQLPEDMGSGLAWGDYDNDGDPDLFVVGAGGTLSLPAERKAPSILYENLGDGTFRPVESFPETRIQGMGAAWGDYDGDGRLDLAVSGYNALLLFHNTQGRFRRVASFPSRPGFWSGVSWADYDNDGDLDLYVCGYVQYREEDAEKTEKSFQYGESVALTLNPSAYDPAPNLLLRNDGDGRFTEAAAETGVVNKEGRSLGALWIDLDQDGRVDLYVANDISDNALFRNTGDGFEEISHASWVADYRGAMGLAAGDWNRDDDDDLFITHWVAQENALYDSLFVGRKTAGDGEEEALRFMDVADQRGLGQIALRSVGWGTGFVDLDSDGWLDLVVINGSTFEDDQTPPKLRPEVPFLLWNQQGEYFYDLAPLVKPLAEPHVGRGLALADYDLDGDEDLAILHLDGGVALFRNDMEGGRSLELRLKGHADGATISVTVGDTVLRRTVTSASYLSQHDRVQHFGLGEATRVERVEVKWPGGAVGVWSGLDAGYLWEFTEGDAAARQVMKLRDRSRTETPREKATGEEPGREGAGYQPRSSKGTISAAASEEEKRKKVAFWTAQRAGMKALKVEKDIPKAEGYFREALALNPEHEDALYYLGTCRALQGDLDGAMKQYDKLRKINPMSHRGHKGWGTLRAVTARTPDELAQAKAALERAVELNQEETGALQVLGELYLIDGDMEGARQRFQWVGRTNPQADGAFFMLGYIAWKKGDDAQAREFLEQAVKARGPAWKPEGSVAEGDVKHKMHVDATPLLPYVEAWQGDLDPDRAFAELARKLG